jgi:tRNA 5-methylaminomethyl-2-thiouridine biosynthesis bifunctional protein
MYRPEVAGVPRLPVAGDGYAIALDNGSLLCGATRDEDRPAELGPSTELREADHHQNLSRLERLTGIVAPADPSLWSGRSGWRLQTADRLPIAGAVPLAHMPQGQRMDQVRMLPRERGLFVLTALGARGLTLAPLLGRLIAAQATGLPWPLEQDLADAVDPARWLVREARRAPVGNS